MQPTCCIFCYKGELYALYTADQRLFLLVQKVGFTSQEASAFLFPKCSLGLCSDGRASPGLPVSLSHGPRICVCYFLAVTSCWVSFSSFVKAGNTEGGALETEGSLRSGTASAAPYLALCQGHWGRPVSDPDLQTHMATPVPGYWNQFCSLKIRFDDRKD